METAHNTTGHETTDASIRPIVLTGVGLALMALMVGVVVYGIFEYLATHPATSAPANPMAETERQQFPPAPRIEDHPDQELKDLHKQEDVLLSTYGWTDKNGGVVRIPIDRAIDLQLQRGFPARKAANK